MKNIIILIALVALSSCGVTEEVKPAAVKSSTTMFKVLSSQPGQKFTGTISFGVNKLERTVEINNQPIMVDSVKMSVGDKLWIEVVKSDQPMKALVNNSSLHLETGVVFKY